MKSLLTTLPLLALCLTFSASVQAHDNVRTGIECKYRDGWYIQHLIEINCLETGCAYRIGTRQATVESGQVSRVNRSDSQDSLNEFEIQFETGTAIRVKHTVGKRYEGILDFGSGNSGYHEQIRCKVESR